MPARTGRRRCYTAPVIGANISIVGLVVTFLAFLVAVGRFAVAGLPGRLPLWQVATIGALAAFLGHGLVDYILEAHSIFILFWMLCGLAATATLRRASFSPRRSKGA